jgi:cytochrome b561
VADATTAPGYGFWHKTFHWLIFALIAAQYVVGSVMPHIGNKTIDEGWVAWHISLGAAILFFIVLRLIWRIVSPVPLLAMSVWQARLASFTHTGLYVLILIMTVLGWAATSYRGWTVWLFGIIPLPSLAAKGTEWAHTAGDIHAFLVYVLGALILLHIAAGLYHYYVLRDRTLQRMLPSA